MTYEETIERFKKDHHRYFVVDLEDNQWFFLHDGDTLLPGSPTQVQGSVQTARDES